MATSYQKRFYYTFKDITNQQYTVEIWKLATDGTVTATLVKGAENPFIISLPAIDSKFQSVRGSGCQINLLSETNMQFLELYTADMFGFMIKAYKSATLIWCGYLDSELYTEPFNELTNYDVTFSGSDGFALLERLTYLDAVGAKYIGLDTQFNILKNIITKIGLPFTYIYIYLSTTITGVSNAVGQTLLNNTYVLNSNFYDEDGVAFTLRQVLESILKPYGAFITQNNGNLYLTDVQAVASSTLTSTLYYNISNFIYVGTSNINANIGDLSAIKFASSDQSLNIVAGVNKEIIGYSPYRQTEIISYDATEDFKNNSGTFVTRGAVNYQWKEFDYITASSSGFWTKSNNGHFMGMQGLDGANTGIKDSYLKIPSAGLTGLGITVQSGATAGNLNFTYKAELPTFIKTANYSLKINMSIYLRTVNDLNNAVNIPHLIQVALLVTRLKIGSKKYHTGDYWWINGWVDTSDVRDCTLTFVTSKNKAKKTYIEDSWQELGVDTLLSTGTGAEDVIVSKKDFLIPLADIDGGVMEFSIYGYRCLNQDDFQYITEEVIQDCRIKDINFTIVDSLGNDVEKLDTEYVGYLNSQYKNEGDSIDIIQGTNVDSFPTERGGLLCYTGSTYSWIKRHTRATTTDNIENLLLRSYVGNYENKTLELTCTTNIVPTTIGYLTYNNYLTGKKFMIIGCENNYAEMTSKLVLQEIFIDALTINKTF